MLTQINARPTRRHDVPGVPPVLPGALAVGVPPREPAGAHLLEAAAAGPASGSRGEAPHAEAQIISTYSAFRYAYFDA